jgi:hypothetical protein
MTDSTKIEGSDATDPEEPHAPPGKLVFISHDSHDAALAEAFSKLLGTVSAGILKTFRSSDKKGVQGFEYGVEWYPELMKKLDSACDIVCLLTKHSLGRPWILYEAGVGKGKLDIPVYGLALGVPLSKASTGPFAQFQNCDDDSDSLTKLVEQLVRRLPNADPDHELVKAQVELFKEKVNTILKQQSSTVNQEAPEPDEASTAKLFEEIKVMFQDLPSRLDRGVAVSRRGRGAEREYEPGMIMDFLLRGMRRNKPTLGFAALIIGSALVEDLPWLYQMCVELYRTSLAGNARSEQRAYRSLIQAAEAIDLMGGHVPLLNSEVRLYVDAMPMMLREFEANTRGAE